MNCPKCNNRLSVKRIQGGHFYLCRQCKGLWVEDEQLADLAKSVKASKLSPDLNPPASEAITELPAPTLFCPQCELGMLPFNYCYDSNVLIDRCDNCKGIWLDSMKLVQIAKFLKAPSLATKDQTILIKQMNINNSQSPSRRSELTRTGIGAFFELITDFLVELID